MGDDDRYDRKGKDRQFIAMPYLLGYQKDHPCPKKQQWDQPLVMLAETMPQRARADSRRKGDHKIFKTGIMNDIDPQNRQAGHRQRKNSAVYCAKHRSRNAKRVPIDSRTHPAKITLLQQCCK